MIYKLSEQYIKNGKEFLAWAYWNLDLYADLLKAEYGGINFDLDQRVFLRVVGRFYSTYGCFPRGWSKCVTGDTLLFTDKGIKEIGEYFDYQNDGIETYYPANINMINRNGKLEKTSAGIYNGYMDTKKIITEEGYSIESTLNHPLLTMTSDGNIEWKKTKDFVIGDYLIINRKNDIWGNNLNINVNENLNLWFNSLSKQSNSHLKKRIMPIEINSDISLLFGYLIGDGCLTRDNIILFSNKDEDIINNYKNIMKNEFNASVTKKSGDNVDFLTSDKYLRKYFELLGLKQTDAFGKEIPKCIMESTKNIMSYFLRGLFDTDGTVDNRCVSLCTVSEKMAKQIQVSLLNYGIISRLTKKYNKDGKFHYLIFIYGENIDKFKKEIGFGCKVKSDKLELLHSNKKRNTNKDIIPYQLNKINDMVKNTRLYKCPIKDTLGHVLKGNNELTYQKLKELFKFNNIEKLDNYEYFKDLDNKNYFFSKILNIEDSKNHVYDIEMPETHSFIGNGIVNHNTFLEILAMYLVASITPNITLSITAQTKENSVELLESKHNEIIKFYPLLAKEISEKPSFSKNDGEVKFISGAVIDTLANSQTSKGQRRNRIQIEESALLNDELFQDALKPIVNQSRITSGKLAVVNPYELNNQINFFTTTGFRGSTEFQRNLTMIKEMADCKGSFVFGADWRLAEHFGRGLTKSQILAEKENTSPIFFAQNYEQKWVGAVNGALVDINKLLNLRNLTIPEFKSDKKSEYYMAVDVARSEDTSNNQSSVVILKVLRDKNGRVKEILIPNLINISNDLTFFAQSIEIKRIAKKYSPKICVIDSNGVGKGLLDELIKEAYDPITNEYLGCWGTVNNPDIIPDLSNHERILFDLKPQSANTQVIVCFMDMVDSGKLRLLEKKKDSDFDLDDFKNSSEKMNSYIQTDFLIEEISNLKLKELPNRNLKVEQNIKKINKDRYSALAYGLWYIKTYEDNSISDSDEFKDLEGYFGFF